MAITVQRKYLLIASIILASLLLTVSYSLLTTRSTETVNLHFEAVVGGDPVVFDQLRYSNPGGEGQFKIRSFLFYLSNVTLIGDSENYIEADSYHLARFDNGNNAFTIELSDVPRQRYKRIEFSIGVDETANNSIKPIGDLDPNSRMAWSWDFGYKFVLFEGGLYLNEALHPLVYHVGFDENYKSMAFNLDQAHNEGRLKSAYFKVDIMRLFTGATTIDMAELSTVKFDTLDAQVIANNYAKMIALK